MILSPCVNSGKRYYTGDGHIEARAAACLVELLGMEQTKNFEEGYLSDCPDYKTSDGRVFGGYFRDRMQAYHEAKECGQLKHDTKLSSLVIDGVDYGLDSSKVVISTKQKLQARAMVYMISPNKTRTTKSNVCTDQVVECTR